MPNATLCHEVIVRPAFMGWVDNTLYWKHFECTMGYNNKLQTSYRYPLKQQKCGLISNGRVCVINYFDLLSLYDVWLVIIALWWWFCPCRVGGAVWNHTAWLFPLMPLPTLSLFYSYFLSGNKCRKNTSSKNIGQFQFCINLLPLELIWRSASCPRHWNQRWFGDAAFTIPSGKQWDHMSPWPPSWLSADIDECCRSANESGHQWLKHSWLETIWH